MTYKITWHKAALEDLKRLDKPIRQKIFHKIETYLAEDPASIGKPLKGTLAGMFRYRFGDYRIIYVLDLAQQTMSILAVNHRKKVYSR